MRIDTDLTEDEREAVQSFARRNNLTMKGAYTRLLKRALRTRVGVDFTWGDRPDEFMVRVDYGTAKVGAPFGAHVPRDRVYIVSAECAEDIDGTPLSYPDNEALDDAEWGITYDEDDMRRLRMSDSENAGTYRLDREDITLKVTDEGPALHIGDTEILLRTFIKLEGGGKWGEERVEHSAQIDCDGDNGCWFILTPDDRDSLYPWVDIQPEVRYLDTDTDQ